MLWEGWGLGRAVLQEAGALTPAECDPSIHPGERSRGATHAERAARRRGARGGRARGARPDAVVRVVARGAGTDAAARAGGGAGWCRRPCWTRRAGGEWEHQRVSGC